MQKVILLGTLFLLSTAFMPVREDDDFISRLSYSLDLYQSKFLREKVYLHIDRSYFQPGDDLWFKAYTVNGLNNKLSVLSKTLFVTIVSPAGDVVQSGQFLIRNGRAWGDFTLSPSLSAGQYELIAYSSWMKNFSPEDVYRQKINLRSDVVPNLFVEATFGKEYYEGNQKADLSANVVGLDGDGLENLKMQFTVTNGFDLLKEEKVKVDAGGQLLLDFELPDQQGFVNYVMRVEGEYDNHPFHYQWLIPTEDRDFDLQFMPEGGQLIEGKTQRIAFKCIDNFGRAVSMKAVVKDDRGNLVDTITSTYQGMGSFKLSTESGRRYFAQLVEPTSSEEFLLKTPKSQGTSLTLDARRDDTLAVTLLSNLKRPSDVNLVAIHQDNLVWSSSFISNGDTTIYVPKSLFPVGVNRLTAFNKEGLPMTERLIFMHADSKLDVSIETDKQTYRPREQVKGKLKVLDDLGQPIKGAFSLSVSDGYLSNINSTPTKSILSTMLLTSELKGDIPTPDYYFMDDNPFALEALDLVMLTHGWRRFLWDYVLLKDLNNEPSPVNQDLKSGTVYDKKGNIVTGAEVQIVQLGEMNAYFTETDERGKFYLPFQISSRQSMNFVFNADLPGKSKELEVRLDTEDNDPFKAAIINELLPTQGDLAAAERAKGKKADKRQKERDVFADFSFGGNYTLLKEVEVVGKGMKVDEAIVDKGEKYELRNQMSVMSHYFVQSRGADALNFVSNVSTTTGSGSSGGFIDLVKQITNIYKYNPETGFVILRTNDLLKDAEKRLGALVVLNGSSVGQDLRVLNHLNQAEIEKIDVIKTSAMAIYYGNRAAAGAILVTTKQGIKAGLTENFIDESIESKVAVDNNYSIVTEFYSPKYSSEEELLSAIPDVRKTLYWDPELVTDDNGEAEFSFYADDRQTVLQMEVQGMSGDGLFGFQNASISVDKQLSAKKD